MKKVKITKPSTLNGSYRSACGCSCGYSNGQGGGA